VRVLITRPREDAEPLATALRAHGVESMIAPLIEIRNLDGPSLDLDGVQALLATSANGVRAFAAREPARNLPVYAVGDATARTARAEGFEAVKSASGNVAALAALVRDRLDPDAGALTHVAGTKVAGDLSGILRAAGFRYRREVLYEARAADRLPTAVAEAFRDRSLQGIVMYSPRTAAIFVDLVRKAGLDGNCGLLSAFCLSRAVAERTSGITWKRVIVAAHSDQSAMVEAVIDGDK
jgi:uroporphyrinogen-III synthase